MTQENQNPSPEQENPSAEPVNEAAAETPAVKTPEQEIAELNQKIGELQDNFLRAKAEGENIRRRAVEDIAKAHKFAIESFAEHLVPVTDSLYAALSAEAVDAKAFKEGLEITLKQLLSAFEKGRMTEINPAVGDKFDPHHHQAISAVPSEQEPNTVVSVLQRGYSIADRVLRPALVMVSAPK
ncbi:nucleotide exchange factor GrpE [Polynucleobacter sphagniphilus]|uniref:nucleotide exchange factor GrpE n=1 Tax=Polynucleobacter sphagniphilus TaxID=1743169 RepID=UPI0024752CCD|nr:nucleotide exchange factor GrpE [Polynucleobacter sphagniphilus]MDH6249211.1 molecular chaperone GrpE [Polynucleobacter sphagniphilus]MDH6524285.1 molecular chaperone GrpE [Polynucleobacter sphagniphilus]